MGGYIAALFLFLFEYTKQAFFLRLCYLLFIFALLFLLLFLFLYGLQKGSD